MGIKSTQRILRAYAQEMLCEEIEEGSNSMLEMMLDVAINSGDSKQFSSKDAFTVSNIPMMPIVGEDRRISRGQAQEFLRREVAELPNRTLETIMDRVADTNKAHRLSYFDNFSVVDYIDRGDD